MWCRSVQDMTLIPQEKFVSDHLQHLFLILLDGAMTYSDYCDADVFRVGLSSHLWSLIQTEACSADKQLPVHCIAASPQPYPLTKTNKFLKATSVGSLWCSTNVNVDLMNQYFLDPYILFPVSTRLALGRRVINVR